MCTTKLKTAMAVLFTACVLALGAGMLYGHRPAATSEPPDKKAKPAPTVESLPAGATVRLGSLHLRHGDGVSRVIYSPDGKLLASAGGLVVRLWDPATGQLVRELRGHASFLVESIAFSPDGKLLASGGADWTVRLWDVATGGQIHLLKAHGYGRHGVVLPLMVAFSPDGTRLFTGAHEGVIQVWDVASGRQFLKLMVEDPPPGPSRNTHRVMALAVSADGKTVAAALVDKKIVVWDLASKRIVAEVPLTNFRPRDLKFLPDGKTLAWCESDDAKKPANGALYLWDRETGTKRVQTVGPKDKRVHGIASSRDGKYFVSAGDSESFTLWDLTTDKALQTFKGHTQGPWSVAFAPDGKTIASGSQDGSVRIWDMATGKEKVPNPAGHWDHVTAVSIAPDGRSVLLGARDHQVRQCDLATGRLMRSFTVGGDWLGAMAFSQDGSAVAAAAEATIELWDVATGRRRWSHKEFRPFTNDVRLQSPTTDTLSFSPDGKRLATTTSDSSDSWRKLTVVRIWDVATGKLLTQLDRPFRRSAAPLWGSDADKVILHEWVPGGEMKGGIRDIGVRVFEAATGKLVRELNNSEMYGNAVTLAPSGKLLATGTSFNRLQFWDPATGELRFSLQGPHTGAVISALAFAPDGTRIASVSDRDAEVIQVWELATGKLTHEFPMAATALAFTPDGKKLVAGFKDGTALVWDLTDPRTAPPPRPELSLQEIQKRWVAQASGYDTSTGNKGNYERADALVAGGDRTVAFLEEQLLDPKLPERDREWAHRLIAPLAQADLPTRTRAIEEIERFGDRLYLAVHGFLDVPATEEDLKGVEEVLLQQLEYRRSSHGSFDVLRQIATPRARRLLAKLADGPADTQENRNRKLMAKWTLDGIEKLKLRRP
jgi:WD40 repeat protein